MEVQMRFRTDGWHFADMKSHGTEYVWGDKEVFDITPTAEPGDVWRIHWAAAGTDGVIDSVRDKDLVGPLAGYAICCIKCGHVHVWTTANNCSSPVEKTYKDSDGNDKTYKSCIHSGTGSCWNWTGSAEDNTLTATPSLQCLQPDCNFHGFITNGVVKDC
jgi:hypothetical protein